MRNIVKGLGFFRYTLWIALVTFAVTAQAETTRVSASSNGTEAVDRSFFPAISQDGRYVAFKSYASNLVVGDNNGQEDIFVHDRQTGETTRANVASDGTEANDSSGFSFPAISGNGRYVVFDSRADNLVAEDNNGHTDIFVRDRESGETTRVSVASDGTEANGSSLYSEVSADGRYVSFESKASNLVAEDNNGASDIFLHDRETGETIRVNLANDGTEANAGNVGYWAWLYSHPISKNGRYMAFTSPASNLVANDNNAVEDVFVRDLETGEITRVSVASDGKEGNQLSLLFDMSENGRYVIYSSAATNLVPDGQHGLFVHDRDTGETTHIDDEAWDAALSGDGRYVAFSSHSDNLVPADSNDHSDVFVCDQHTRQTALATVSYSGSEANANSWWASISEDGQYVAFYSGADNLVPGDNNSEWDIFVTDNPHLFRINASLNDAWYNPGTPGQGFLIIVYPETKRMFVTWVTFDTDRPGDSVLAYLGDPGHRWLTAQGPYTDHQAVLDVAVTTGGIFNSPEPVPLQHRGGTLTVNFTACTAGSIAYDIPSIGQQGVIPIQRISLENVAMCEALQGME